MSKNRIKDLELKILKARADYYNSEPSLSDKVFDAYVDELSELDPKNIAVTAIGSEPISNWEKYTHLVPMGSLNKCQTYEEFIKWSNDYIGKGDEYFVTLKLDGLSVSLIYENGVLVKGCTRGSGVIGELITASVAKMMGVPLRLRRKINATVRGEILLSKENLAKFFPDYSNSRNGASGIARRYDLSGSDKLTVLTYQLTTDDIDLDTQYEQFITLQDLGFMVPPFYIKESADEVLSLKDEFQSSLRDKFAFDLDGLVIHNNDLNKCEAAGSTNGRPKASIAYKFDSIAREAYVKEIVIQIGNSGRVTPVAVFSPKVNLMGAEVERASLHNFANIRNLGIDVGSTVLVCRSNDVIPFVEEVVNSTGTVFKAPTNCPECNSLLIESGEYIQCPNVQFCRAQIIGRVANFIKDLNLLEWGDSLIQKLVDSGKVITVADLYRLTIEDLASLDRMGERSAQKAYDILWANPEISLDILLGALSIQMIGSTTIRAIMDAGYDTLNKITRLTAADLEKVSGVGPTKAKFLADGLKSNEPVIAELLKNGIKIKEKVMGKLTGKSFALTGTMVNKRSELEQMIVEAGGTIKSVGKSLTCLVIADPENSQTTKAVKARSLGVKLISEDDLLTMVK